MQNSNLQISLEPAKCKLIKQTLPYNPSPNMTRESLTIETSTCICSNKPVGSLCSQATCRWTKPCMLPPLTQEDLQPEILYLKPPNTSTVKAHTDNKKSLQLIQTKLSQERSQLLTCITWLISHARRIHQLWSSPTCKSLSCRLAVESTKWSRMTVIKE